MRKIIILTACFCLAVLCDASTVTVEAPDATSVTIEADDFTAGADISNALSNINLSKNSTGPVYAVTSTRADGQLGANAIGHAGGELWNADDDFMIDFNGHAKTVSLDLIAYNDTTSYVTAYLEAYDDAQNLITFDQVTDLYKFSTVTLSVTTSDYDIAYVIVYHVTSGSKICLDNIQTLFMADYTPWADFEKIQDAIDYGVFDGINDEIVVYPGAYFEEINFYGFEATIRSTDPQDPDVVAATIIDSMNSGIGVRFSSLEGITSVLNGLTIRNADKGIYCYWSSPVITNCVIKNNNIAGIELNFHSAPTITNCLITENPGCGVMNSYQYYNYHGEFSNCTISDNESFGILNYGGDIRNCIIAGNLLTGASSCQYLVSEIGLVPAKIRNCTIVGNKSNGVAASIVHLTNNIIANNFSSGVNAPPPDPLAFINSILEYNDIWGNLDGSHSGGVLPSPLDIHKDPYFAVNGYWFGESWIDDQADYHLKSTAGRWDPALGDWVTDNVHSPCIDAGDLRFPGYFDPVPEPNGVVSYYAVICGIADYVGNDSDLNYPDDDAFDFRNALLNRPNWNDENIIMLLDRVATKDNIHSAIQDMAGAADENDVCVFFFSGHGTAKPDVPPYDETDGLDEYLCTTNREDISDDELGDWLKALPTQNYIVFLDTCFSGGHAMGDATPMGLGDAVPAEGDGFAADLVPGPSDPDQPIPMDLDDNGYGVVLTASGESELSWETSEFGHSVFAYYLLEAMANTGGVDTNFNEWISAEECFAYIEPKATEWAEDNGYYGTQHAQLYDGDPNELDFLYLDIAGDSLEAGVVTSLNILDDSSYIEPHPNGGKINIGAYGGTEQASKSTTGIEVPVCINRPQMDFTGDCRVGLADFAVFTQSWLTCGLDMQETCW